jgi:hypothetical protein
VSAGLSIVTGIALAAAAGFRAFVPLLAAGLAIHFGIVAPAPGFAWLGEPVTLTALTVATLLEIAAYYIPGVDHALDLIAAPIALAAGVVVAASVMTGLPDWLRWLAAIVAGGAATTAAYTLTSLGRAKSTALTGGMANPLYSTGELIGSSLLATLAFLLPIAALVAIAAVVVFAIRRRRR